MKKIIIHIGLHKTGTTSIQDVCFSNRFILKSYKIAYPDFGGNWNNHSIPLSLIFMKNNGERNHSVNSCFPDIKQRSIIAEKFRKYLIDFTINSSEENILLSGEDISLFTSEEIEGVQNFFETNTNHTIEIICYVRDPESYTLSAAQELVRAGIQSFETTLEQGNLQQAKLKINKFTKVFGKYAVKVYDFNQAVNKYHDVVQDFFEKIGCGFTPKKSPRSNSAMSMEKLITVSNKIEHSPIIARKLAQHLPDAGTKIFISDDKKNKIWATNNEDLRYLEENFGIKYTRKKNETEKHKINEFTLKNFEDMSTTFIKQLNQFTFNENLINNESKAQEKKVNLKIDTNYDNLKKGGIAFSIAMLSQGWKPLFVVEFPKLLYVLVLRHENNTQAAWYFNKNYDFIGNKLSALLLDNAVTNNLICLFISYVVNAVKENNQDLTFFKIIKEKKYIYTEFISLTSAAVAIKKQDPLAKDYQEYFSILNVAGRDIQDNYISSSNKDHIVEFMINGVNYWSGHTIVINDFTLAYLCLNTKGECVVLFESGHYNSRVALIDCASSILCATRPTNINVPLNLFLEHMIDFSEIINKYLSSPCLKKVGLIRSKHLGHNLWNDLSGLHRLKIKKTEIHLREVIVFGGNLCEPWIDINKILPNTSINYQITDHISLRSYIYKNNLFLVRISDNYILKSLPDSLIEYYQKTCPEKTSKLSNELRVVIGLRFENRTWLNQVEGIVEIAKYLATKTRKLSLIIDGHDLINSTGKIQASHHEPADDRLTALEKSVVDALLASLSLINIKVIDAVGKRLDCSVKWINSSDFFIAPWGAGLAKYKWISNLPGIIFTSQWNLKNKPDLKIYESTSFREGATPCLYVAPEYIEDHDCSTNNIKVPDMPEHPSRADFIVDINGIKIAIDELLFQIGKAP